jgi:hypothetical protein
VDSMKSTVHPGISICPLRKAAVDGDIASLNIGLKLLIPGSEIQRVVRDETQLVHVASVELWNKVPTNRPAQQSMGSRQDRRLR